MNPTGHISSAAKKRAAKSMEHFRNMFPRLDGGRLEWMEKDGTIKSIHIDDAISILRAALAGLEEA